MSSQTLFNSLIVCLFICLPSRENLVSSQLHLGEPSSEAHVMMKHILRGMRKHIPKMMERVNISQIAGPACNKSWHEYMIENDLTAEKFSAMIDDFQATGAEKLVSIVRPEKCIQSQNGKFCQVDHLTNITLKSKSRVFDMTYALCYPRECSNDELNRIFEAMTESYQGMINIKMTIKKCLEPGDDLNKFEIDTARKNFEKISGGINRTLAEVEELRRSDQMDSDGDEMPKRLTDFKFVIPEDIELFLPEDIPMPPTIQFPTQPSVQPSAPPTAQPPVQPAIQTPILPPVPDVRPVQPVLEGIPSHVDSSVPPPPQPNSFKVPDYDYYYSRYQPEAVRETEKIPDLSGWNNETLRNVIPGLVIIR